MIQFRTVSRDLPSTVYDLPTKGKVSLRPILHPLISFPLNKTWNSWLPPHFRDELFYVQTPALYGPHSISQGGSVWSSRSTRRVVFLNKEFLQKTIFFGSVFLLFRRHDVERAIPTAQTLGSGSLRLPPTASQFWAFNWSNLCGKFQKHEGYPDRVLQPQKIPSVPRERPSTDGGLGLRARKGLF